jgi:3-oxoacyl-[acyl-carrier protein] reductase
MRRCSRGHWPRSRCWVGARSRTYAICGSRQPRGAVEKTALNRFGRVDIVVNSAGATKRGEFFGLTDADFDDGFALKFMGAVRMTREAWPYLVKAKGAIVNIIGMGGRLAEPDFTIGGPVNAALMNFTKAMSIRGVSDGVRATGINSGLIETDRIRRRMEVHVASHGGTLDEARQVMLEEHHIDRLGKPEEIGKLVCYLAGTPGAFMQGSLVGIDGGGYHAM